MASPLKTYPGREGMEAGASAFLRERACTPAAGCTPSRVQYGCSHACALGGNGAVTIYPQRRRRPRISWATFRGRRRRPPPPPLSLSLSLSRRAATPSYSSLGSPFRPPRFSPFAPVNFRAGGRRESRATNEFPAAFESRPSDCE